MPLFSLSSNYKLKPKLDTYIKIQGNELVIPEGLQTIPCTHGLHRFPGKFIPNIPRFILRTFIDNNDNKSIFDPFCGSGTTLVEAALEGRSFYGMDIDPLAIFIASAKTYPINNDDLTFINDYWSKFDYNDYDESLIPNVPNIHHWFSDQAILELSAIKSKCLELPQILRLFCLVVFSSIIRRVSNADDQTQKTYVSHTHIKTPPLPSALFPVFLKRAIAGMKEFVNLLDTTPKGQIILGDSRFITIHNIDHVITSPPYIDSIDYVYNQMLEYFWLLEELGILNYEGFRIIRKAPMGFNADKEDKSSIIKEYLEPNLFKELQSACKHIGNICPKEEMTIYTFFYDFITHCKNISKIQSNDSLYICIIGDSMIRKVKLASTNIIMNIFNSLGYKYEGIYSYQIRRHYMKFPRRDNSGRIDQDNILIFKR